MYINRVGFMDEKYSKEENCLGFFKALAVRNKNNDRTYYVRRGLNTMYYDLCVIVHNDTKSYDVLPVPMFIRALGIGEVLDSHNYWLSEEQQKPIFKFFNNFISDYEYDEIRQDLLKEKNRKFFKKHEKEFSKLEICSLKNIFIKVFSNEYNFSTSLGEYDEYEIINGKCWISVKENYYDDEEEAIKTSQFDIKILSLESVYNDIKKALEDGRHIKITAI